LRWYKKLISWELLLSLPQFDSPRVQSNYLA
jgi:hypothetical protein